MSAEEAQQLTSRLTPVGAERAGNAEGTIPAWTGAAVAAHAAGPEARGDPFSGEKPIETIDSSNAAAVAESLPDGQNALLKRFPDYRLEIFPSHRTAAAPAAVYESVLRNATRARAAPEGIAHGVAGAAGGIPFPIPHDGFEAIWNHLLAFWGAARSDRLRTYLVAADGTLELTHDYRETVDFPYYYPGAAPDGFGRYYLKRLEVSDGPPELAGRGYLVWQPIDNARDDLKAWQYLPGQRRVRQAPSLSYDTPTPDGGGILSFDDYYVFSGSPDRYEFTLLGKREMFIPYNNNRFSLLPADKVLGPRHADPGSLRYERHRVWVVDAKLAPGQRHLAPHRRLYLDEDTWFAVYCDAWDTDGRLWKSSEGTMYLVPELPAVILGSVLTYDLRDGGYVLSFAFNGEPDPFRTTPPHAEHDFTPESLAADASR